MKISSLAILIYCFCFLLIYNVKVTKSLDGKIFTIKIDDQIAKTHGETQSIAIIQLKSK
ncbi:MAG: hypothetical protein WCK67_12690 [bacterium]